MNVTLKPESQSWPRLALILASFFALVVAGCTLAPRTAPRTVVMPVNPPDITPFIETAEKIAEVPWAATYTIVGTDITSTLQVIFGGDRAFVSTALGGLVLELYLGLKPSLSVTACAITSGVDVGCFPLDVSSASSSTGASQAGSSTAGSEGESESLVDRIAGLINSPGTRITTERLVPPGADAQCLKSPATNISNVIQLCVATSGGLLFYSNGEFTVQATAFSNVVDPSHLVPPPTGGGLAGSLG